jgi:hypothetical protein
MILWGGRLLEHRKSRTRGSGADEGVCPRFGCGYAACVVGQAVPPVYCAGRSAEAAGFESRITHFRVAAFTKIDRVGRMSSGASAGPLLTRPSLRPSKRLPNAVSLALLACLPRKSFQRYPGRLFKKSRPDHKYNCCPNNHLPRRPVDSPIPRAICELKGQPMLISDQQLAANRAHDSTASPSPSSDMKSLQAELPNEPILEAQQEENKQLNTPIDEPISPPRNRAADVGSTANITAHASPRGPFVQNERTHHAPPIPHARTPLGQPSRFLFCVDPWLNNCSPAPWGP